MEQRFARRHSRIISTHAVPKPGDRCVWCERPLDSAGVAICADCVPLALRAVLERLERIED